MCVCVRACVCVGVCLCVCVCVYACVFCSQSFCIFHKYGNRARFTGLSVGRYTQVLHPRHRNPACLFPQCRSSITFIPGCCCCCRWMPSLLRSNGWDRRRQVASWFSLDKTRILLSMSRQVWGTGGKDRHRLTITLSQTRRVNVSQLESKKKTYTYALTQHFGCSSLLTAITPKCLHRRF